jgi:hypothetical protein
VVSRRQAAYASMSGTTGVYDDLALMGMLKNVWEGNIT